MSLVRPSFEYASAAWSPYTDTDIKRLEQVQKSATRFVCGDYKLTTRTTGQVKTHWKIGAYSISQPSSTNFTTTLSTANLLLKSVAPALLEHLEGTTTATCSYNLISSHLHTHFVQDLLDSGTLFPRMLLLLLP